MKNFLFAIVAAIFLLMAHANAEIQTYTGEGSYAMSEGENLGVAKERAKADAMRNASEKAGVYVKSYSRAIDNELDTDIIETMTSSILKIVVEPQFSHEPLDNLEGFLIHVTVKVQIDSEDVIKWLNKSDSEKNTLIEQNQALRKANEEQERQIAELKRQLANATTLENKKEITQKFEAEDKIFLSNQKVDAAWKLYSDKNFAEAAKLFDEAANLNSNNANAWYGRGTAYNELKQYEQAISDFDKAISLDSDFHYAYNNRGLVYMNLNQNERAILDFDAAISINPKYFIAYNNRGLAYLNLRQHDRAIADFDAAISINPNYSLAYNNRGLAYDNLKQFERALLDFNEAISINPNYFEAYNNRGLEYLNLNQHDRAIADLNKAIELNPKYFFAYNNRGWVYYCMKNYEQALSNFDAAIAINPNYSTAKNNRERCLKALGR